MTEKMFEDLIIFLMFSLVMAIIWFGMIQPTKKK